jgi:pilus assembly protein FimV
MAYNKSKYVEAAQKLLNQGKVAQAIAEYQQILKYEPRDQVTLMTIGELYIRQGETFQAIDYFERLAQLFVSDGFLTKAIAVYKRIAKLAPEEIRPLEKLADLYVQQGVMSEARPLFLQLAELHLKNNKQADAIALLKKLLLAEPDNLRIQIRLADLYQAMGQTGEALEGYVSAAQRALARGDHAECEKLADKALHLSPKNLDAMIVKARAFSTVGNVAQASQILEQVPDLDKGGEPAELLLDLYLKNGKWDEGTALALKIFTSDAKNFGATQKVTEALLEAGQGERAMSLLSRIRVPMIDAGEHEGVVHLLTELATRLSGRLEPLEWLVDTYGRTSDSFRLPDALAHLGDALVAAGKLDRAKETFEQLVEREPESDSARRKLNEVLRKLGLLPTEAEDQKPAPQPEVLLHADFQKTPAPKVRPSLQEPPPQVAVQNPAGAHLEDQLDEDTQKFIAQSLTDVDLFASYGLTQKAIGLLEAILRRAPTHTPTLEKLLDFVLGAGDDRRTAELAATLEHIHQQRGDTRSSERFGELRRRFQRAAGLSDEEISTAVAAAIPKQVETMPVEEASSAAQGEASLEELPVAASQAVPEATSPEPEISEAGPAAPADSTEEHDLSDEWASLLEQTKEPAPQSSVHAAAESGSSKEADIPEFSIEEESPAPSEEELEAQHLRAAIPQPKIEVPTEDLGLVEEHTASTSSKEIPAAEVAVPDANQEAIAHAEATSAGKLEELLPTKELPVPEAEEHAKAEPVAEESKAAFADVSKEISASIPPEVHEAKPAEEPQFEVEQDIELILEPENLVPAHEMLAEIPPPVALANAEAEDPATQARGITPDGSRTGGVTSAAFLSDLAKEIDQLGLGDFVPAGAEENNNHVEAPAKPLSPGEPGPLKEVFDEFRAELGEMGVEDEDLETHYNLGIAFREMGLLEEAIGEFQKVAKANDHGKAFRYAMQCCTLLGLAFMEKGQPGIAAIWYERALVTPGVDAESKLALRYDLGVAQESAGDLDSALKSFSQVYAVNIDYRDVAERIASLQKPAR